MESLILYQVWRHYNSVNVLFLVTLAPNPLPGVETDYSDAPNTAAPPPPATAAPPPPATSGATPAGAIPAGATPAGETAGPPVPAEAAAQAHAEALAGAAAPMRYVVPSSHHVYICPTIPPRSSTTLKVAFFYTPVGNNLCPV